MRIYELMPTDSVKSFTEKRLSLLMTTAMKHSNLIKLTLSAEMQMEHFIVFRMVGRQPLAGTSAPFVVIVKRMG